MAERKGVEGSSLGTKRGLISRPKKSVTLEPKARELMVRKWGEKFIKIEEEAATIFTSLEP